MDIWDAKANLEFNKSFNSTDEKFVETESARDSYKKKINDFLNIDNAGKIKNFQNNTLLFCGHRGSGKSTELKDISKKLEDNSELFPIYVNGEEELDIHNLKFPDLLLAMMKELIDNLETLKITIDDIHTTDLKDLFKNRVITETITKDIQFEAKGGIKLIIASLTSFIKLGSNHKEEIRTNIINNIKQFTDAFNLVLKDAEDKLQTKNKKKLVFILDGTDKLNKGDERELFEQDASRIKLIEAHCIYAAPISLLLGGGRAGQDFQCIKLPMIKIKENYNNDKPYQEGYKVLREMVDKRVDKSLFDSEETVNKLIKYSGGNPRELLRLLLYTFIERGEEDKFHEKGAEKAIKTLANEYRYFLTTENYQTICDVDNGDQNNTSEEIRKLLLDLAILEYNSFWRSAHPVITTLDRYKNIHEKSRKSSSRRT